MMVNTRGFKSDENPELLSDIKKLVQQMFASKDFLEQISVSVSEIVAASIGDRLGKLEAQNEELRQKLDRLDGVVRRQNKELDDVKQEARLKSLCLFGIFDNKKEDTVKKATEFLISKFGNVVKADHICVCHRLGRYRENSARPILITFDSMCVRNKLFNSKSTLKGTDVVIRESLSPERLKMLKKAIAKFGSRNVWTSFGKIFIKDRNQVRRFTDEDVEDEK